MAGHLESDSPEAKGLLSPRNPDAGTRSPRPGCAQPLSGKLLMKGALGTVNGYLGFPVRSTKTRIHPHETGWRCGLGCPGCGMSTAPCADPGYLRAAPGASSCRAGGWLFHALNYLAGFQNLLPHPGHLDLNIPDFLPAVGVCVWPRYFAGGKGKSGNGAVDKANTTLPTHRGLCWQSQTLLVPQPYEGCMVTSC